MSDTTPEPPPVNPEPPIVADSPATETGLKPNIAAGLAMLFSLIGGIVFLILEKKNAYVRFYSLQAIALGALWIVIDVLGTIASLILGHVPVLGMLTGLALMVLGLAYFVVYVIGTVKAFTGKEWEIPWVGKQVRTYQATGKFPFVS